MVPSETSINSQTVPDLKQVLALPIQQKPLFPGIYAPIRVQDQATIESIKSLQRQGTPYVGVFLHNPDTSEESPFSSSGIVERTLSSTKEIHSVGALAQFQVAPTNTTIEGKDETNDVHLVLSHHRRIRITDAMNEDAKPLEVKIETLKREDLKSDSTPELKALSNEVFSTLREVISMNPMLRDQVQYFVERYDVTDPSKLADLTGILCQVASSSELQDLFETLDSRAVLEKSLVIVKQENEMARLQKKISSEVEEKITKQQREYMLKEQMKKIKEELGIEKDDKTSLIQKYEESLMEKTEIPKEARKVIDEEMERMKTLEKNSSEFNVTRNYLDWLTSLPWGNLSEDVFDVSRAQDILDQEHHGMKDVKDRILEFIAVSKLKNSATGKIICLVGPPGVGKTSIGKSIAKSLNREFYRFSVGGMSDVSEIKGHRRTYIGAMPGKPIQCLKQCGTSNPLILIDEIDKLGRGHQGDPASALLELLDMNQNDTFTDHYLDVPVDMSKALFVCTANVEDTIPGPLHDRMEMIRLPGYDLVDKMQISKDFLDKKVRDLCGLSDREHVTLNDDAVQSLIRWYCREAGVRNLEKHLERIYRKVALEIVRGGEGDAQQEFVIDAENLHDYVGKPVFTSDRLWGSGEEKDEEGETIPTVPVGVTTGLAWTSMGGSTLYVAFV